MRVRAELGSARPLLGFLPKWRVLTAARRPVMGAGPWEDAAAAGRGWGGCRCDLAPLFSPGCWGPMHGSFLLLLCGSDVALSLGKGLDQDQPQPRDEGVQGVRSPEAAFPLRGHVLQMESPRTRGCALGARAVLGPASWRHSLRLCRRVLRVWVCTRGHTGLPRVSEWESRVCVSDAEHVCLVVMSVPAARWGSAVLRCPCRAGTWPCTASEHLLGFLPSWASALPLCLACGVCWPALSLWRVGAGLLLGRTCGAGLTLGCAALVSGRPSRHLCVGSRQPWVAAWCHSGQHQPGREGRCLEEGRGCGRAWV